MPRVHQARVQRHLQRAGKAPTTGQKGALLEDLVANLFGLIPGVRVTERNEYSIFDTEEIDIACWNDHLPG